MLPTLEQVLEFSRTDLEAPKPPSPYEIALRISCALLSTGKYGEDAGAAIVTAWTTIPTFYAGRLEYEKHMRMLAEISAQANPTGPSFQISRQTAASPVEGAAGEAPGELGLDPGREYVTGGETGQIGEARTVPPAGSQAIDLDAVQARQGHIQACAQRVMKASLVKESAAGALSRAKGPKAKAAAQEAFDLAEAEWQASTKEQSEAYL